MFQLPIYIYTYYIIFHENFCELCIIIIYIIIIFFIFSTHGNAALVAVHIDL